MTIPEIQAHVDTCGQLMLEAYARFQTSRDPADREEARKWMQVLHQAIRARNERVGGERHAAFEQRLSQGLDYFNSEHALALARGLA